MCGIHGIVNFNQLRRYNLQEKIRLMLNITKHRGSDQVDSIIFDRVALGTNRLAIIAPTEHSTIQHIKEDHQYALFNGEIVNYRALRKLLKYPPHNQHTDSALILPLFKQFGAGFIKRLAGMFAIAIYDHRSNQLQVWRDPLGVKPLYYYHSNDSVIFSSEVKAIYAVLNEVPEIDFAAIDHILRYRFHPGQSTVFPEIKRVLPGETVIFKRNKIIRSRYWTLTSNKERLDPNIEIEEFREFLVQIINEYGQADVKGGFFVSGGLDSSLVTSIALKSASPYRTPISIQFSPRSVVDEEYGKLLERFFRVKFNWVTITDAVARRTLMELVSYIDEPLENPIHVGTYLMSRCARELGIKSVLTGDGSDEFFLGYERIGCWFSNSSSKANTNYLKLLCTMKPEEAVDLYTDGIDGLTKPIFDSFNHRIEPFKNIDQVLLFERLDHLSEYHNMRLDRMTMAHSVEARVPFQDHRLVEHTLRIPLATLFGTSGKEWLQKAAEPFLPRRILNRPKVHFPSLPDQWLSGDGANWATEILLDHKAHIRKWIKSKALAQYLKDHRGHIRSRGRLLWALVVLELWLQNLTKWRE